MTDPEDNDLSSENVHPPANAPADSSAGPTGNGKKPADSKASNQKAPKASKPTSRDIYRKLGDPHTMVPAAVDGVLDFLDTVEDPAPLIATLLKDFMSGNSPQAMTTKLREYGYAPRLFERLCSTVGRPDLGSLWDHMGRDGAPVILDSLRGDVPATRNDAEEFLKERKALPYALLIFRAFRNDENAMGRVLREWLCGIAEAFGGRRNSAHEQTQRTAGWLVELTSKKLKPGDLLKAVAPTATALRSGDHAIEQADRLAVEIREVQASLAERQKRAEELEARTAADAEAIEERDSRIRQLEERLRNLEESLQFNRAHAAESVGQATGALRDRLKGSVLSRIEDARLFLDRPEPNVGAVMELLTEIEEQFE